MFWPLSLALVSLWIFSPLSSDLLSILSLLNSFLESMSFRLSFSVRPASFSSHSRRFLSDPSVFALSSAFSSLFRVEFLFLQELLLGFLREKLGIKIGRVFLAVLLIFYCPYHFVEFNSENWTFVSLPSGF